MATPEPSGFRFSIDLPVTNEWQNVDLLRTSVQNCFQAVFHDMDGCNAVAMVTGELLENALKYGNWEAANDRPQSFRLHVEGEPGKTTITVSNPVVPGQPGVAKLMKTIEWIRGFDDPGDAYRARLIEIAQSDETDTSQLGLVRVAYEGNCGLDARLEGDTLIVTAELKTAS